MEPRLVKAFEINATVGKPSFIGQDGKAGRRQLISITGGEIIGFALPYNGTVLPDGVELSAQNGSMVATFTLSEQGQVTLETDSSAVAAENAPEGMEIAFPEEIIPLTVTVKGNIADITDIAAEDIVLFADLSEIIEPGEYEIPISGRSADGKEIEVTVEPVSIFVTLTGGEAEEEEKPEETEETTEDE